MYLFISLTHAQNNITVAGFTGGEMDSFLQVAELLFAELLTDPEEVYCWTLHVDLVRLLESDSFTPSQRATLRTKTIEWKALMVKLYGEVQVQGAPLSFAFPNFELVEHWADQIEFLGPPWFQDTKLWERCHLAAKRIVGRSNRRDTERDILLKVRLLNC